VKEGEEITKPEPKSEPSCSFCNQPRSKNQKIIVGDAGVCICERCIALCYEVLRKEGVDLTIYTRRTTEGSS
jgi:ATP-dependent protease Clp ATPase subunit